MKTRSIVAIFMLVLPLICMSGDGDADRIDSVRCGSDLGKALLGRTISNEKVNVLEERHKDLGLKDLGGTEISDRLFWRICGQGYFLLEEKMLCATY
jgi:hypothetical protein